MSLSFKNWLLSEDANQITIEDIIKMPRQEIIDLAAKLGIDTNKKSLPSLKSKIINTGKFPPVIKSSPVTALVPQQPQPDKNIESSIMQTMNQLSTKENMYKGVTIGKLQDLIGVGLQDLHTAILKLMKQGLLTGSAIERNANPKDIAAGIKQGGLPIELLYLRR